MGAVFIPMFDTILVGLEPHEVGSGSAILQATQQLGMSLGVAIIGTVFFSAAEGGDLAAAASTAADVSAGLIVAAFLVAFLLPTRLRATEPADTKETGAQQPIAA